MGVMDHWHPVLNSDRLRQKPVGVKLHGQELVLFRTGAGRIGALTDICPHRRMRLSLGKVVGERLQCKYHGWTYDCVGEGESPGTPKLTACAESFETREAFGVAWVKPRGVTARFPQFEVDGWLHACTLQHYAKAPLELALDNFCEIEHTPTTHAVFGYPLERMQEVTVRFEPTDTTVRVINEGPPKQFSRLLRLLLGIRRNDHFHDDWTTHFSPVYTVYDHWWADPITGRENMVKWKLFIFLTPASETETTIFTVAFTKSRYPIGPYGAARPFRGLMRRMLAKEIELDVQILEGLASQDTAITGMKLSRFDRVLGLNRERIEKIYRGVDSATIKLNTSPIRQTATA